MNSPSKTFKRLGIVGAAAVVGLVPIGVLSTSAYAVSSASLTLASTVPGQTTSATNTFTVTNSFTGTAPETLTVTANGGETLPTSLVDYSVTVGGTADTLTAASNVAANPVTLDLTTAATAGQQVVVTITGVVNPGTNSSVYFTDQASSDTAMSPANTNAVSVAGTAGAAATVTSVNPQAFQAATGEPFTVIGSGFGTTTAPTVCFVPTSTTTLGSTCALTTGGVAVTPTVGNTATELQGFSPTLGNGTHYNVVVFNSGAAGSATSTATLVSTSASGTLNFVPESGVRAVDTRVGLGLPASQLNPGTAYAIPVATFENSAAVPTNVPAGATAVALNVTATAPASAGNIQVWASTTTTCSANADVQSTVNFQQPQDTNNATIVALNAGGAVCVQDNGASVNVVMDVTGYATAAFTSLLSVTPPATVPTTTRLLDSRPGAPAAENLLQGPLAGGTVYRLQTSMAAGTSVAFNVTAVGPTGVGNLRVFPEPASGAPAPSAVPNTAAVTYIPGVDAGSLMITQVGNNGYIDLYSDSAGTVNVVIDEVGTFGTGSSVNTISPVRMIDTRPGGIAAGGTTSFTAVPFAALPTNVPSTALGVIGDLADIQASSPGYLVAYPGGTAMPGTANIANFPGQTRSTTAFAAVNPSNGQVSVSSVGAMTNFTFDATAYIN